MELYNGDCLEILKTLAEKNIKVDLVLTDLPYGVTKCEWDSVIPLEKMWETLQLVCAKNIPILLFGIEPFSSKLRLSNIKNFKYDWIWVKNRGGNFVQAKNKPINKSEIISVFSTGVCIHAGQSENRMNYYPQNLIPVNKMVKNSNSILKNGSNVSFEKRKLNKEFFTEATNYPTNVLYYNLERGYHPTQKPVELLKYLIKTYTKEENIVLDFTMGSGSTGVACVQTNRKFIGIEKDVAIFNTAKNRIEQAEKEQKTSIFCI